MVADTVESARCGPDTSCLEREPGAVLKSLAATVCEQRAFQIAVPTTTYDSCPGAFDVQCRADKRESDVLVAFERNSSAAVCSRVTSAIYTSGRGNSNNYNASAAIY